MSGYGESVTLSSLADDSEVVIKARLPRADMQMLDKLVEGLGHLGIVTTTNRTLGEVMILSTRECWPDLKKAIVHMPFQIEFLEQNEDEGERL